MADQNETGSIGKLLGREGGLTPSEVAVVEALIAGRKPTEIAASRNCSVATVRVHIRTIFYKLNIHSVNELFSLALSQMREREAAAMAPVASS
jgi:DNA-binding NarL/FixJ family response regulator